MKRCPYCAEEIQDAAVLCRFCNSSLAPGGESATIATATRPAPVSGRAVASLVFGILWLWWVGAVLALMLGYSARAEIRESDTPIGGDGLAVAGIVLGWVWIGLGLLALMGAATGGIRIEIG